MREVNMARQKAGLTNLVGLPEGSWTPPSSTGKGTNSKWEPLCEYLEVSVCCLMTTRDRGS